LTFWPICSSTGKPTRRYVDRDEELMKTGLQVDFDCMVEVAFSDQNAFLAYMGKLFGPEAVDDAVAVDEAKFLDRSQTRAYVVDERVTAG
jgi:hypothetical protein